MCFYEMKYVSRFLFIQAFFFFFVGGNINHESYA